MAVAAHQEESPADDVLIWRYAASRAHQAAEEARARALEATAAVERADRRLLKAITPQVQRFVRGVRMPRRVSSEKPVEQASSRGLDASGAPGVWAPSPGVWAPVLERRSDVLWAEEPAWAPQPLAASFDDILLDAASVPLPAALLAYDDLLEWLQRLHGRGLAYGNVRAAAVDVDQEGRCTLREGGLEFEPVSTRTRLADLQAATWVFVEATGGLRVGSGVSALDPALLEALPLPARGLVEQTLAVEAAYRLTAARLRSDLAVAARAFLQEDWEHGARAWLASAAAASGVELAGRRQNEGAQEAAVAAGGEQPKRPVLFGGITRREPRFMVGLGIAASTSITLVVGAAVGFGGTRPPAHTTFADRPAIVAPPSAVPTVNASPASFQPSIVTPSLATPVPTPRPTAPPVHAPPPPITAPPTFTPFPVPTASAPPTPAPTPCWLLGLIC